MPTWQPLVWYNVMVLVRSSFKQKISNKKTKNNFLCLRLLVCVVRKLQHYKRMAYVLSNHFSTQTFVVEL